MFRQSFEKYEETFTIFFEFSGLDKQIGWVDYWTTPFGVLVHPFPVIGRPHPGTIILGTPLTTSVCLGLV